MKRETMPSPRTFPYNAKGRKKPIAIPKMEGAGDAPSDEVYDALAALSLLYTRLKNKVDRLEQRMKDGDNRA